MSNDTSNREKKRGIQAGVRALKQKPGWDPSTHQRTSPEEHLRDMSTSMKTNRAYTEADTCAECEDARKQDGDTTALCSTHLAEAMGLG